MIFEYLNLEECMEKQNIYAVSSVCVLLGSSFYIGGVVAGGIYTGLISAMGTGLILFKLKDTYPRVWAWMMKHSIMTDLLLSGLLAALLINNTVTGIISAAGAGLFVSAGITLASRI